MSTGAGQAGRIDPPPDTPTLLDLFHPDRLADPYPYYSWLRDEFPVYWDDLLGTWVVARYDDIVALAKDARLSEDRVTPFRARMSEAKRSSLAALGEALGDMMLFNDAPRHTELRGLVKGAFSRSATDRMRPVIEAAVADLIDQVIDTGRMDIIRDFSQPLSRTVIADLLGIQDEQRHLLDDWASLLHEFFTLSTAQGSRLQALRGVFDSLVVAEHSAPSGTLLTHMLTGCPHHRPPSTQEMFANFLLVIDAGQVTTTYLVGNAVRALIDRPDQLRLLRTQPEMLPRAAAELMRFDSSVQFTTRIARSDLVLRGARISAGDPVTLLLGSGNRDPSRFDDPDRLDVSRNPSGHLGFGHGAHYCVGAPLALLEIEIAIGAIVDRLSDIRRTADDAEWHDSINFRFLKRLPITFTATPAAGTNSDTVGQPARPDHRRDTAHV